MKYMNEEETGIQHFFFFNISIKHLLCAHYYPGSHEMFKRNINLGPCPWGMCYSPLGKQNYAHMREWGNTVRWHWIPVRSSSWETHTYIAWQRREVWFPENMAFIKSFSPLPFISGPRSPSWHSRPYLIHADICILTVCRQPTLLPLCS